MTAETISYRFVVRRGVAAAWAATNEILLAGEWGLESDTKRMKVGDGVTAWGALPYFDRSLALSSLGDVDNTALADGTSPVWSAASGKHVYKKAAGNYQPGVGIDINVADPDAPIISSTVGAIALKSRVATYAALPASGNTSGDAYLVDADGLVYVWNGLAWPANGAGLRVAGGGAPAGLVPKAADFTTIGTFATLADRTGRLALAIAPIAGNLRCLTKALPSAPPYTIDLACSASLPQPNTNEAACLGLLLLDASNKLRFFYLGQFNKGSSSFWCSVDGWTSPTAFSTQATTYVVNHNPAQYYLRITDDGTTRRFWFSNNGLDFVQLWSENTNTFVTPTKIGIGFYSNHTTIVAQAPLAKGAVVNFKFTPSVLGDAT